MGDKPRYLHGQVTLALGGTDYTLLPTPEAYDKIDREFGGIVQAIERVRSLSLHAVSRMVIIGIGTTSKGGQEKLKQLVFEAGVARVGPAIIEYLLALANPAGTEPDGEEAPEGNG